MHACMYEQCMHKHLNNYFVVNTNMLIGFTPMPKLIRRALKNTCRKTVNLLFFNKTEGDVMWRDELTLLAERDSKWAYLIKVPFNNFPSI